MTELDLYIKQYNAWDALLGGKVLPNRNQLTQTDADRMFARLENELSPENLSCDGELRGRQLANRHAHLTAVVEELKKLGFTVPAGCYELN
jgi:hypothetical protein